MAKVDSRFIVQLQGKDFVTYEGLLDTAHQMGLIGISTEIVELPNKDNGNRCIMKATAKTEKGSFEGYGDADPTNVNSFIKKHIIRMAETRAKARALRDLTNIGMTAIEELGGDEEIAHNKNKSNKTNSHIAETQVKELEKLIELKGVDKTKVLSYYKVKNFKEMTTEQYEHCKNYLKAK